MMDEGESVRSGRSERSERSHRSHGSNHHSAGHHRQHGRSHVPSRSGSGRGSGRGGGGGGHDTDRDDRSVTIKTPGQEVDLERGMDDERIQVQVIPQDDNWGDNTTAITGNTSETGFSMEDLSKFAFKEQERQVGVTCARYVGTALTVGLSVLAFLSPIAMVLLPKLELLEWRDDDSNSGRCPPECEGLLISLAFKLLVLLVGAIALFFRKPKATMPRVFVFRAIVLFLVFVLTFAFWLFYGVRIFKEQQGTYEGIVKFAVSLVDSLLFVHYVAIILLEIRQLQPQFSVRVVRSPDGEVRVYNIGSLSIQRAAVSILEQYYRDFETYNPYLENVTKKHSKQSSTAFKVYDIDGSGQAPSGPHGGQHQLLAHQQGRARAVFAAAAHRRRDAGSHNDRFYDEQEYERRVRKRRARLLVSTEEAFTHIKRLHEEQGAAIPMDPMEAAAAVFPSMARPLQKYLRVTRQQPRYTMDAVLGHLALCIAHDMSPRAFLARYFTQGAVVCGNDTEVRATERWVLVCEQLLTRELDHGSVFLLKKGMVSLLCTVSRLPHLSLTEEVQHPKANRFVLRLNSETSV